MQGPAVLAAAEYASRITARVTEFVDVACASCCGISVPLHHNPHGTQCCDHFRLIVPPIHAILQS